MTMETPMNVQTIYAQQMSIIRGLRDRHLATVDDALSVWRPRADLPPIAWHAAHASLFTAITLCGMGAGDWTFATADEMDAFNFNVPLPEAVLPLSVLRPRIAAWDKASDTVAAHLPDGVLGVELPHRRAELLPDTCRTWLDALLYMVTHEPFHHGEIGVLRRLGGHSRVE